MLGVIGRFAVVLHAEPIRFERADLVGALGSGSVRERITAARLFVAAAAAASTYAVHTSFAGHAPALVPDVQRAQPGRLREEGAAELAADRLPGE